MTEQAAVVWMHQRNVYLRFYEPEISILVPAYNERDFILKTIFSLTNSSTKRKYEIIVINNNSTDDTEAVVKKTGVRHLQETVQGITAARNAGLGAARGKYILNADADVIYPPDWIDEMIAPLERPDVAVSYGRFAFLPDKTTPRWKYYVYECIADTLRFIRRKWGEEAVNVYGFNFGFRKEQGIAVDWFNHPRGAHEDGWMALKLRDKGFGKLHLVHHKKAMVWSLDRRLQNDGGLWKGFKKRMRQFFLKETEPHKGLPG